MAAREVREVVLPLDASVGPHARVEEDAALGRPARAAETEGQRAVDELVARRPVGRAGEELADLRGPGVRVDAGGDVDDDEFADEVGVGCRDRRRGEPAERLTDEQLRTGRSTPRCRPRHPARARAPT